MRYPSPTLRSDTSQVSAFRVVIRSYGPSVCAVAARVSSASAPFYVLPSHRFRNSSAEMDSAHQYLRPLRGREWNRNPARRRPASARPFPRPAASQSARERPGRTRPIDWHWMGEREWRPGGSGAGVFGRMEFRKFTPQPPNTAPAHPPPASLHGPFVRHSAVYGMGALRPLSALPGEDWLSAQCVNSAGAILIPQRATDRPMAAPRLERWRAWRLGISEYRHPCFKEGDLKPLRAAGILPTIELRQFLRIPIF